MISRLVTPGLIITVLVRLRGSPVQFTTQEEISRYKWARDTLSAWAERIEKNGLTISLEAIAENALICAAKPENKLDLAEIGNRLIDSAIPVEQFLHFDRYLQTLKLTSLSEAEQAAASQEGVDWRDAAKEITSAKKNSSDADKNLRRLCKYLLTWDNPEEGTAYRAILSGGANGEKPHIPKPLVPILKKKFVRDRSFLRDSENN